MGLLHALSINLVPVSWLYDDLGAEVTSQTMDERSWLLNETDMVFRLLTLEIWNLCHGCFCHHGWYLIAPRFLEMRRDRSEILDSRQCSNVKFILWPLCWSKSDMKSRKRRSKYCQIFLQYLFIWTPCTSHSRIKRDVCKFASTMLFATAHLMRECTLLKDYLQELWIRHWCRPEHVIPRTSSTHYLETLKFKDQMSVFLERGFVDEELIEPKLLE